MGELAPGGGYLLSSVHTIMTDVPAANILAMVDAVEAFGTYRRPPEPLSRGARPSRLR